MGFDTPVKLNDNVYWVGCDNKKLLNQNVYLYKDEDIGVLIDPADTQAECMFDKISEIMPLENIKYVVIQNYEPDTVKVLESIKKLMPNVKIVTHWKISVFLNKFDLDFENYIIDENDWKLKLKNKELNFIFTPFNYFAGSFCTYDAYNKTLFSSDLFSAVKNKFQLYVDKEPLYLYALKTFHQLYLPVEYMKQAIHELPKEIEFVFPRYGSILEGKFIEKVKGELLKIDKSKNIQEMLEDTMSIMYKNLIYLPLEKAMEKLYEHLINTLPTLAFLKVTFNKNRYHFGQMHAKYSFYDENRIANNIFLRIEIGINSLPKEEEITFIEALLSRLFNVLSMLIEKQIKGNLYLKDYNPVFDELTGAYSTSYFHLLDSQIIKPSIRHNYSVSLGLIELNLNKNETIGKLYKECILRECATLLKSTFRGSDIIIRDENKFLIIMPFTKEEDANKKLTQVNKFLNEHSFCGSREIKVETTFKVKEFDKSKSLKENLKEFDFSEVKV
ncbi:diguanylate cyclase domain-containing protein [Caminibacter mediatlanticus]|uniref:Histidine kinase n=1 Tax=Caminibacter mediatlanticus TB-2 TaxID=391592 RepID=A0AAI9F235_9BACT|nr:diguanylate cyclase [Caminibacter mediatlanticus]EDM23345.1 histidine kinase [Caminibacter mediatlanticus TB-2]